MEKIRGPVKFALLALAIITVVFAAVVSPWKGLSIATFPVIMTGLGCWIGSVILLFRGLGKRKIQPFSQMTGMAAILLVLAFVPVAYAYMVISGQARTKITVAVSNRSGVDLHRVRVYGSGNYFLPQDTLKMAVLPAGQSLTYVIWPDTKPVKGGRPPGNVVMEFDADGEHVVRAVAGAFSGYPSSVQQEWATTVERDWWPRK